MTNAGGTSAGGLTLELNADVLANTLLSPCVGGVWFANMIKYVLQPMTLIAVIPPQVHLMFYLSDP
jgi:hypothetical protein